ncbi:hypothetical protein JAO76_14255 [Pontibacter sp. BT310]|jgi:hypothetical protein|uniref:Uncharacterized protein n=1 Tax=Pontibacter populi TaxID=890055 RepID=A0ABS6XE15_9BACT|nr:MULTISPECIES: hypothetical protein [Pontibacter]MBJ6119368.1 hypothetical protein [Pontibacter sp. BT310]MBR0571796.1 hypothetical protein [Microvirga sp. STS03]MBW3366222.1 hypothetical protein [Pontibacter populi]
MNIKVPVPQGSKRYVISLTDILRIENRSLSFFGAGAHNLYIFEKTSKGDELFSLYSYGHKQDMLTAFSIINSLLAKISKEPVMLELEPMD